MANDFRTRYRGGYIISEFSIEGLRALEADLYRMGKELATKEGVNVAKAAMMPVAADTRNNIIQDDLVDTGALKRSVRVLGASRPRESAVVGQVRVGVGKRGRYKSGARKAAYALQLEYGTLTRPERPFLRPAFDGKEREIGFRTRQLLRNRIIKWKMNNFDRRIYY